MARSPRRNHSPTLKAKVALATLPGEHTLAELAQKYDVITDWKRQLQDQAVGVFDKRSKFEPPVDLKALHAKIGELTLENDFLAHDVLRNRSGFLGVPVKSVASGSVLPVRTPARFFKVLTSSPSFRWARMSNRLLEAH